MAQPNPPAINAPGYGDFPGADFPTGELPNDPEEAGNVLLAEPSEILNIDVAPIANNTQLLSLPNPGNLCFRNSTLHSLLSLTRFVQLLEEADTLMGRPIYHQLRELARRFRRGDLTVQTTAVDPVWDTIVNTDANPISPVQGGSAAQRFQESTEQHDAADFLEYLLTRLISTEVPANLYEVCNPVYRRIFAWEPATRNAYDCSCQQKHRLPIRQDDGSNPVVWTTSRYVFHVNLDRRVDGTSLAGAISRAMYQDMDPNNNLPRCASCGEGVLTGRFWKFLYLPEVLPIAVQYFWAQIEGRPEPPQVDFKGKIDLEERIDLSNLCERPEDKRNAIYKLQSVVLYRGTKRAQSTAGHYISYIRRGHHAWDRLNDTSKHKVRRCTLNSARKQQDFQPRILFYVRESPEPATGAVDPRTPRAIPRPERDIVYNPVVVPAGAPKNSQNDAHRLPATAVAGSADDDDAYKSHITLYNVQWKPTRQIPAPAGHGSVGEDCGCSGGRSHPGPAGDTSAPHLRGGDGSGGGQSSALYPDFEKWTDAQLKLFKAAFKAEGLVLLSSKLAKDWREILEKHLKPTGSVDYTMYTISKLRKLCNSRGIEAGGSAKQTFVDALKADDAPKPRVTLGPSLPLEQPHDSGPAAASDFSSELEISDIEITDVPAAASAAASEHKAPPSPRGPANARKPSLSSPGPANAPESPAYHTPGGAGSDDPDPILEERLQQVEALISVLEKEDVPCNCPWNGQQIVDPQHQHHGAQTLNRGLHIRLTAASGTQTVGPRDYWFPIAPLYDSPGLTLQTVTKVYPPAAGEDGVYPVQFSFSGPEPLEGWRRDKSLPQGETRFRNTIRFTLPFYVRSQDVAFDIWQEDIPYAPLLDTSSIDVALLSQPAGSTRRGTPGGGPRTGLVSTSISRGPQAADDKATTPLRKGRRRTAAEADLGEGGNPPRVPRTI